MLKPIAMLKWCSRDDKTGGESGKDEKMRSIRVYHRRYPWFHSASAVHVLTTSAQYTI